MSRRIGVLSYHEIRDMERRAEVTKRVTCDGCGRRWDEDAVFAAVCELNWSYCPKCGTELA